MNYIAYRTDDGKNVGKIRFYCKALEVSRQAFYDYLKRKEQPWKYQPLADAMLKIHAADIVLSPGQKTEHYKMEELKFMVWRYFMNYWSNRRICSAIGGLPSAVKRQRFYAAVAVARFAS